MWLQQKNAYEQDVNNDTSMLIITDMSLLEAQNITQLSYPLRRCLQNGKPTDKKELGSSSGTEKNSETIYVHDRRLGLRLPRRCSGRSVWRGSLPSRWSRDPAPSPRGSQCGRCLTSCQTHRCRRRRGRQAP